MLQWTNHEVFCRLNRSLSEIRFPKSIKATLYYYIQDINNMATSNNPTEEDEQHHRAFSTLCNTDTRANIALIRDNDSSTTSFYLRYLWVMELNTGLAWQLLGRYIANNTHLKHLQICSNSNCFNDERMVILFGELVSSSSIERIDLSDNQIGIDGLRCAVPFLKSTRSLYINLSHNILGYECFDLLIDTLYEKPIKELNLHHCGIRYISTLRTNTLPQLEILDLGYNQIRNAGIMIVSDMMQKKDSRLTKLNLSDTGIDDKGAELLADSLKQNTTLKHLSLVNNNDITEKGCLAFLKLVHDVSSIENTYNSNHTLKSCDLTINSGGYADMLLGAGELDFDPFPPSRDNTHVEIKSLIEDACRVNSEFGSIASGLDSRREKVIQYQLHSQRLETLCRFQGIEYSPGNIFASIEPVLLPNILDLIGNKHGQSELYTALIHTAPELLSYIDRKALIRNALAKVEAEYEHAVTWYLNHISQLSTEKAHLNSRLAQIDLGDEAGKKAAQQRATSLPPLVEDAPAYDFNDTMAKLQMSHDEYVFPWSEGIRNPDDEHDGNDLVKMIPVRDPQEVRSLRKERVEVESNVGLNNRYLDL